MHALSQPSHNCRPCGSEAAAYSAVDTSERSSFALVYVLFLIYAFNMHGGYLFIDSANLVVHEGGTCSSSGSAPPSTFGEERFCNAWCHYCSQHIFFANDNPPATKQERRLV
jgi:hypothetical protein